MYRFLLVILAALVVAVSGCRNRPDLEADTVRVSWSDRRIELVVISCGLDDDVFVLGAESSGAFVQMLLVTDGEAVDPTRSAVTVEVDVGTLGAGSADLLGVDPGSPGAITNASIRGDRIDVDADARILGQAGSPVVSIEVDARCPAVEDFV